MSLPKTPKGDIKSNETFRFFSHENNELYLRTEVGYQGDRIVSITFSQYVKTSKGILILTDEEARKFDFSDLISQAKLRIYYGK